MFFGAFYILHKPLIAGLVDKFQYVGGGISHTQNQTILRHQQGVKVQLDSDTVYLVIAPDSTGQGFSLTRLSPASTSEASSKPRLLLMLLTNELSIGGSHDLLFGLQTPVASLGCLLPALLTDCL